MLLFILFQYSIKALESLKCFKSELFSLLTKSFYQYLVADLNNDFVFPDAETAIINILHG